MYKLSFSSHSINEVIVCHTMKLLFRSILNYLKDVTVEPASLEDVADLEVPGSSASESMTSPSEYLGRSRMSHN